MLRRVLFCPFPSSRTPGSAAIGRTLGASLAACALTLGLGAAPASAADTSAPNVSVSAPAAGATVAGSVNLGVSASDNVGVTQVKWYVDGAEVAWDGAAPFQQSWDSRKVADGTHQVFAKAADAAGNWGTSAPITVTVANTSASADTTRPTVSVSSPTAGATVTGSVSLGATASDNVGVTQTKWFVDGVEVAWDGAAPWQQSWDSRKVADGTHQIEARAADAAGNWASSAKVSVTVKNATSPSPSPTPTPSPSPTPTPSPTPAGWQLVVSDSFDALTVDPNKWMIYGPNWPGHNGNGLRDGRAISVQNGVLNVTAQMLNGTLVSGGIASRLNQTYGRFEFRARTDPDPSQATSAVVLTWPQSDNWPSDGENDIYETLTTASRTPLHSFVHFSPTNQQYWFDYNADGTQWHHMAMEWEPTAIRFYMDGTLVGTVTDQYAIPDVPHHLCIQLDAFKQTMTGTVRLQVDDVRIYKRA